jgi:transcriptional regulator with XRE-family HTH domain
MAIGFKDSVIPDGAALRRAREAKGWSQEAVVASSDGAFGIETLRRAERGKRISREKLDEICAILGVAETSVLGQQESQERLQLFVLEIPQPFFARHIAQTLGCGDQFEGFVFFEETGDLDPNRSRLILRGGVRLKFRFEDIQRAQARIISDLAKPLTERGMHASCWVVQGFKERWAKSEGVIPTDAQIICVLETSSLNLNGFDSEDLADELIHYAFDLPNDADRSFLNSIPKPSITKDMLTELVRREAWSHLHMALWNVGSGIAVLWAFEILKLSSEIKNARIKALLDKTKPKDAGAVRTWAEAFVDSWLNEKWE